MNKRKRYIQKSKGRKSILLLFLIIVPIMMCLVGMGGQYYILTMISKNANDAQIAVEDALGSSTLDTIMSTISIAVSVWIGLNIYNVYKREDVDEALQKVENFISEMTYQEKKRAFLWQLEKGEYMYEVCRYFVAEFEKEDDIPLEILDRLALFEKQFYRCYDAYEKRRGKECRQIAIELLEEMKEIHRCYVKVNISEHALLYSYYNVRMADLLFYKNRESEKADTSEYLKSIELYKQELEKLPCKETELMGYMQNTIGFTYNLLCQMPEKVNPDKSFELSVRICEKNYQVFVEKKTEKEQWSLQAEKYLKEAVSNNRKGRYIQNLGSYYEMIKEDYNEAIKRYKEAFAAEKMDDKIYNLLGAVLLKKVDGALEIDIRFENNKVLLDIAKDFDQIGDEDALKENITKKDVIRDITNACHWLSFALKVTNPIINSYYNYSKACTYYYLFVKKEKSWLEEAYKYLDMVETFLMEEKEPVGYLFTLRNHYEAKSDFDQALIENKKINPEIGDVKKAEEVYIKRIIEENARR